MLAARVLSWAAGKMVSVEGDKPVDCHMRTGTVPWTVLTPVNGNTHSVLCLVAFNTLVLALASSFNVTLDNYLCMCV